MALIKRPPESIIKAFQEDAETMSQIEHVMGAMIGHHYYKSVTQRYRERLFEVRLLPQEQS